MPLPQARRYRKLEVLQNVPDNLPYENFKETSKIMPVRLGNRLWKWTPVVKSSQTFSWDHTDGSFFSSIYFPLNILARNTHPRPEKFSKLREETSKIPKNDYSEMKFWPLSGNPIFRSETKKKDRTKFTLPKPILKTAVFRLVIKTYWVLEEKYVLFWTFVSACLLWWEWLGKTF